MVDRHVIDVHILLARDRRLLLTQRRGGAFDGEWHLPSGKVDAGEPLTAAAAREAREEIGVIIDPAHLRFVHAAHVADSGPEPRLGVFFEASEWLGEPTNQEPDKCSDVRWFPVDRLPDNLIAYPAAGIRTYLDDEHSKAFSEIGWESAPAAIQL
ncbi:NUDIX domain-containing protein [Nocardia zapadnayensis]|nr:NUDIX domain-containing protein [Nocardia zapadnayensis]MCX0269605.1 NUDIX domain-containing protein [Nocardia zapadnayensis]